MPACFHSAAEASRPAWGLTWSRSAAVVGSERIWVPWIQAGLVTPDFATADSEAITMAQAPSEDGQVSSKRIGSQSIVEARTDSTVVPSLWRCAYGFFRALFRSFAATIAPMCDGAPERRM